VAVRAEYPKILGTVGPASLDTVSMGRTLPPALLADASDEPGERL
jgi:hypothetical protein